LKIKLTILVGRRYVKLTIIIHATITRITSDTVVPIAIHRGCSCAQEYSLFKKELKKQLKERTFYNGVGFIANEYTACLKKNHVIK